MNQDRVWRRTVNRALSAGDPATLPIFFHAVVLTHYIERGARILRSDTVGRILQPGRATLDFGIVDEVQIHLRWGDFLNLIPEAERAHWLDHLVPPNASRAYLQMTLQPGSCHDDGELRDWVPGSGASAS